MVCDRTSPGGANALGWGGPEQSRGSYTPCMELVVNGERTAWPAGTTVAGVVDRAGVARSAYAVEVNKRLVPRREQATHELHEGDEVEIVVLVGGG